jgi:hypothetical protein|tara:strand:+ start:1490 stop:1735 length:246 start_codon:yes stop_codon:yes gene_type:complete
MVKKSHKLKKSQRSSTDLEAIRVQKIRVDSCRMILQSLIQIRKEIDKNPDNAKLWNVIRFIEHEIEILVYCTERFIKGGVK